MVFRERYPPATGIAGAYPKGHLIRNVTCFRSAAPSEAQHCGDCAQIPHKRRIYAANFGLEAIRPDCQLEHYLPWPIDVREDVVDAATR